VSNSGFELQRSVDGQGWVPLGFVPGEGDSPQGNAYAWEDVSPMVGINYYRLKQIDWDGQSSFSPIVSVTWVEATTYAWYPNPMQKAFLTEG